ncbi:uncharacterized protein LOC106664192 isoform X2 [Cimex lectularius]|nr:uncharacterized protein LOC106664192 isoform X2 [Cimex lectularius]
MDFSSIPCTSVDGALIEFLLSNDEIIFPGSLSEFNSIPQITLIDEEIPTEETKKCARSPEKITTPKEEHIINENVLENLHQFSYDSNFEEANKFDAEFEQTHKGKGKGKSIRKRYADLKKKNAKNSVKKSLERKIKNTRLRLSTALLKRN